MFTLMSNEAILYWITRMDSLQILCGVILGMWATGTIFFTVWWLTEGSDDYSMPEDDRKSYPRYQVDYLAAVNYIRWWKRGAVFAFISLLVLLFTPSRKEMVFIFAGGKAMDYVQKDSALRAMPYKVTELVNQLIDEKLNDKK